MSDEIRGPEKYISMPLRVFGLDAYSAVGIFPIIIFPFALWSWILALFIFILIFIASRYRLPSYQLFRYFRYKSGPKVLTPYKEQQRHDSRSRRPWPY